MSKNLYLTTFSLLLVTFLVLSCFSYTIEDAKKDLAEIDGKVKKGEYEGDNGYERLSNELRKLNNNISGINVSRGKAGTQKKDLEELKANVTTRLQSVTDEKEVFEALNNEITKPVQKIENLIAFSKYAQKSTKKKKLNEIKGNIKTEVLPEIEDILKKIAVLASKPVSKDSKNFYCEAKKSFFKIDGKSIYAFFGIYEAAYETKKVSVAINSLQSVIKDYDYSSIQQALITIDYKLRKFEEWIQHGIKSSNIIDVDNDENSAIPPYDKKIGFYFRLEGISHNGKIKGRMSKPQHSEQSVLVSVGAEEIFIVKDKVFKAKFVNAEIIENNYELVSDNPKNTLKKGKVIIEIMESNRAIGCDNL